MFGSPDNCEILILELLCCGVKTISLLDSENKDLGDGTNSAVGTLNVTDSTVAKLSGIICEVLALTTFFYS